MADNFEEIYWKFLDKITFEIDINKISSITIAPLIYNQWDYNKIMKIYQKDKDFSFVNNLQKNEINLRTCSKYEISTFKKLFKNKFGKIKIFRDYI